MHSRFNQLLSKKITPKILVIGDLMLDKYTTGSVKRISPEAPIPVLHVQNEEYKLGGALNVVHNLKILGSDVSCAGIIGNDSEGEWLRNRLNELDIQTPALIQDPTRPTTVKIRYLSSSHQLLRVDYEDTRPVTPEIEQSLLNATLSSIKSYDLIIVSDYNKGTCTPALLTPLVEAAHQHQTPIICDPRNLPPYNHYRKMSLLKPNRNEAHKLTGIVLDNLEAVERAAEKISRELAIEHLIITLDKDGMFRYSSDGTSRHFPTEAREVFDVTGAGDTVISVIGYFMAIGGSLNEAVHFANVAASIKLTKLGAYSVALAEIDRRLRQETSSLEKKLIREEDLPTLLADLRAKDETIIFTNGYFEQLGKGELAFLHQLEKLEGEIIVAINSDQSIENAKGHPPIIDQTERAQMLGIIEVIDHIVIFDQEHVGDLLTEIKPDLYVKGRGGNALHPQEKRILSELNIPTKFFQIFQNQKN